MRPIGASRLMLTRWQRRTAKRGTSIQRFNSNSERLKARVRMHGPSKTKSVGGRCTNTSSLCTDADSLRTSATNLGDLTCTRSRNRMAIRFV